MAIALINVKAGLRAKAKCHNLAASAVRSNALLKSKLSEMALKGIAQIIL
jgi:hypothetical protein